MRQVTLEALRESVRVRYDLDDFTTSTKPTLVQVDDMINASAVRLSALLCACYGDDYFTTSAPLVTTADNSLTSLPTNFYKLKHLIWLQGTDTPVEIRRATPEQYARESLLGSRAWASHAPSYRLQRNSQVWWLPRPSAAYDVTCTYVQTPLSLASDSDDIEAGPGWEEWLVNDVCVKIAQVYEQDPGVYMSERNDCEQRIKSQAPDREELEPMAIRDTFNRTSGMGDHEYREWLTRYG